MSLILVAMIWLAVFIWWESTRRVVTVEDAVIYLALMPIAALLCTGVALWLSSRRQHRNHLSDSEASNAVEADPAPANEPFISLPILSAWAVTGFAPDAEEFLRGLRDRHPRPQPDALLVDEQGFPILASRVSQLDTATVQEELLQITRESKAGNDLNPEDRRDALLRTVALLRNLLDDVLDELPPNMTTPGGMQSKHAGETETLRGAAPVHPEPDDHLRLTIKLLIPAHFSPDEQQLAHAYLLHRIANSHLSGDHLHTETIATADDATVLAVMDQFSVDAHRDARPRVLLMLAADSALCSTVVEEWQMDGKLFKPGRPNGLMTGEAAFAILCANDKAFEAVSADRTCRLLRMSRAQRDSSADDPGKPSYACLASVVKNALAAAHLAADSIGTVACDADHRTNRVLECMGAIMDQTPQLDAIQNRLAATEACGHIGAASVAGALVAAVMQSRESEQPVLLFSVSHPTDRAAAVLIPSSTAAT